MKEGHEVKRDSGETVKTKCNFCGQKVTVPAGYIGRKGRCPRCKSVMVIVPYIASERTERAIETIERKAATASSVDEAIRLKHEDGGSDFTAAELKQEIEGAAVDIEQAVEEVKLRHEGESVPTMSAEQMALVRMSAPSLLGDVPDEDPSRVPWYVDTLAFPFSIAGCVHWVLFSLIGGMTWLLKSVAPHEAAQRLTAALLIGLFIMFGYLIYYLLSCTLAAAKGHRRAPDVTIHDTPTMGELAQKIAGIAVCLAVAFGPALGYMMVRSNAATKHLFEAEVVRGDPVFLILIGFGGFCLPMTLLGLAILELAGALNLVLVFGSMFRTIGGYIRLVSLFWAVLLLLYLVPPWSLTGMAVWILDVYVLFVTFALLGRFYRSYEKQLKWEVKI